MAPPRVRLALLWHMHQPYYVDPTTGESILPWVRLHALKDYWGMIATVRAVPGMRVTVNLVPSLVEQIEAYALERTWDRHLALGLADAATLGVSDAEWFVAEGFHAHAPTMILPYPRYAELASPCGSAAANTANTPVGPSVSVPPRRAATSPRATATATPMPARPISPRMRTGL
jgi:alpha-amylase/alpha-mannosidase (GH57 family)